MIITRNNIINSVHIKIHNRKLPNELFTTKNYPATFILQRDINKLLFNIFLF